MWIDVYSNRRHSNNAIKVQWNRTYVLLLLYDSSVLNDSSCSNYNGDQRNTRARYDITSCNFFYRKLHFDLNNSFPFDNSFLHVWLLGGGYRDWPRFACYEGRTMDRIANYRLVSDSRQTGMTPCVRPFDKDRLSSFSIWRSLRLLSSSSVV